MSDEARAWGIRLSTVVVIGLSAWQGVSATTPNPLPDYALNDPWILRGERSLLILALLVIAITIIWRGVIDGQLPLEIGREGLKYEAAKELIRKETKGATGVVTEEVERAIIDLRKDLAKVSGAVDATAAATADAIRQIETNIERLEKEVHE